MGRLTTPARPGRGRTVLAGGLLVAGLAAAVGYLAEDPAPIELAQSAAAPPADECGPRVERPGATTSTTPAPTTTEPAPGPEPTTTLVSPSTTPTSGASSTSTSTGPSSTTTTVLDDDDRHWRCSLVEEFEGTTLDRTVWDVQTTTGSNFGVGGECFVDDPDNVVVGEGTLKLVVRQEPAPVWCPRPTNPGFSTPVTAGSIITKPEHDQTYGRYELRARMPDTRISGLQFAFWLWPRDLTSYPIAFGEGDQDKWANGEIDVLEWYSQYPDHDVPYLHYAHTYVQNARGKWVPNDPNVTKACYVGTMADWHTYTLEWTPTSIRMLFDGEVCIENTRWTPRNTTMPGPFDRPFMVSLSNMLGALGTLNQAHAATPLPATAEIDYLKIWE